MNMSYPLSIPSCLFLTLLCLVRFLPSASADPTLLNGSFESPSYFFGSTNGGAGDNWTAIGGVNVVVNGSSSGKTPFGEQFIDIGQGPNGISQNVTGFVGGTSYSLLFYASQFTSGAAPAMQLTLSGAATLTQLYTLPVVSTFPGTADNQPFNQEMLTFTPLISGSVMFTFTNTGGASIAMDNVLLSRTPAAVPETGGTLTLASLALLALACAQRKLLRARAKGVTA